MPVPLKAAPHRSKTTIYENPDQHLWAISYADLLMVLMSFFIIYFQVREAPAPPKPIVAVVKPIEVPKPVETVRPIDVVSHKLEIDGIVIQKDAVTKSILIPLPDNLFEKGQFSVSGRVKTELERVLKVIRPIADDLVVTIIGHTDEIPVAHLAKVIDSNLILSNLRAAKAVEFAVREADFDPKWVSSEGVGEHGRATRSLTLRIMERAKK